MRLTRSEVLKYRYGLRINEDSGTRFATASYFALTMPFLSFHGAVNNLFRQQRHLMSAKNYRALRDRAFAIWQQDTCAYWTGLG